MIWRLYQLAVQWLEIELFTCQQRLKLSNEACQQAEACLDLARQEAARWECLSRSCLNLADSQFITELQPMHSHLQSLTHMQVAGRLASVKYVPGVGVSTGVPNVSHSCV